MKRYLLLFFMMTTLVGCGGLTRRRVSTNADTVEVSRVILILAEKLKYEKRLHLEDSVVYYDRNINRIRLDFSSMDNSDLWEARELLVDVTEEFLDRINQNGRIYAGLAKTPFDASNLEIYIRYKSFYNKFIDLQTVGLTSLRGGIASYIASDALECDIDCWHRRSEYYWQSKNFVTFRRQGEALYKPKEEEREESPLQEERFFYLNGSGQQNRF